MNGRIERLAPLTGVVWVVLFILGVVIIGLYDYLPTADKVSGYLMDNSSRVRWGGYAGGLSAFFLIWFAGSLRSVLREREEMQGRLSEVAFGGAVAAGVALAAAFAVFTIGADRAGSDGGISTAEAVTLYDLWGAIMGLAVPVSLAVLVGAAGVVSLRRAVFPTWFGWASVAIALVSLSPIGFEGQVLAVLWVLVVSVWLYVRGS